MIEVITNNYDLYNDYDLCGKPVVAGLNINGTRIELCQECMEELTRELNKFNSTIFCYKCKHFIMSKSGWNYGGSCKLQANKNIEEKDAGYIYCVDCMDTCDQAEEKINEN